MARESNGEVEPTGLSTLVVEDEPSIRETLRNFLKRRGHAVSVAGDGELASELLEGERRFELVLTDLKLPRGDGVEVLQLAKSRHPRGYVVLMTGFASLESAIEAIRFGAFEYLVKPFSLSELDVILNRIAEHRFLTTDNERLALELERVRPVQVLAEHQERLERSLAELTEEVRGQRALLEALAAAVVPDAVLARKK